MEVYKPKAPQKNETKIIKRIVISLKNKLTNQYEDLFLGEDKIIYNLNMEPICEQNYFAKEDLTKTFNNNF